MNKLPSFEVELDDTNLGSKLNDDWPGVDFVFFRRPFALVRLDVLLGRVEPLAGGTQDPLVDDRVTMSSIGVQKVYLKLD